MTFYLRDYCEKTRHVDFSLKYIYNTQHTCAHMCTHMHTPSYNLPASHTGPHTCVWAFAYVLTHLHGHTSPQTYSGVYFCLFHDILLLCSSVWHEIQYVAQPGLKAVELRLAWSSQSSCISLPSDSFTGWPCEAFSKIASKVENPLERCWMRKGDFYKQYLWWLKWGNVPPHSHLFMTLSHKWCLSVSMNK